MDRDGIDGDEFKDVMASVAATVTVVTSFESGVPAGITVSAFTSVSVDPPVVLYCVDKATGSMDALVAAGGFTVNFLPQGAGELAMLFATPGADKFGEAAWTPPSVATAGPVLDDAYAVFECTTIERVEMGDHWVLFGHVEAGGRRDILSGPLLWHDRAFAESRRLGS